MKTNVLAQKHQEAYYQSEYNRLLSEIEQTKRQAPVRQITNDQEFHAKMGLMLCAKSTLDYLEVNEVLLQDRTDEAAKYERNKNLKSQKELGALYNSTYRELTKGHSPEYVTVVNNEMEQHNDLITDLFNLDFDDRKRVEKLIKKIKKERGIILK